MEVKALRRHAFFSGFYAGEVPYALAVTLEVTEELGVDIYDEVRATIRAIQVRPEATP